MKRLLTALLVASLLSGCTTTHSRRLSAIPPSPDQQVAGDIIGVVLRDGTEVEFTGHGEIDPAGFVIGRIPTDDYAGLPEGASATRTVRYPMNEVENLVVDRTGRKVTAESALIAIAVVGLLCYLFAKSMEDFLVFNMPMNIS